MTNKRKQHFVPRFYLRLFSSEPNHRSIGVWNVQKENFVKHASLKNQAYAAYFYGKDEEFEEALAQIEGVAAQVLREIIVTQQLPSHDSTERVTLFVYLVYQAERTQYAAEALNESIDKFVHIAFKEDERVKEDLPHLQVGIQNAAVFRLGVVSKILPIVTDLEMKLLRNKTDQEFVTSDNPVVKYNQFMEFRKWPGGHTGWANVGLQVFFPISPSLYLVLYDKDIYRIGFRRQHLLAIEKSEDVDQLNALQLINANRVLYFGHGIREDYIKRLHRLYSDKRSIGKMSVEEYHELNPDDPEVKRSLIAAHAYNIKIGLSLSCIQQTKRAKRRQLGPSMANPRNPRALKLIEERWKRGT
jgi:hypothetical protein